MEVKGGWEEAMARGGMWYIFINGADSDWKILLTRRKCFTRGLPTNKVDRIWKRDSCGLGTWCQGVPTVQLQYPAFTCSAEWPGDLAISIHVYLASCSEPCHNRAVSVEAQVFLSRHSKTEGGNLHFINNLKKLRFKKHLCGVSCSLKRALSYVQGEAFGLCALRSSWFPSQW